ncbi:hypothetical protein BT69DRAFT_1351114 [Atractiella rhizophila]|nr:hypothetical protein BT69DRAFT_1351114 [Atractiella rhizophila]
MDNDDHSSRRSQFSSYSNPFPSGVHHPSFLPSSAHPSLSSAHSLSPSIPPHPTHYVPSHAHSGSLSSASAHSHLSPNPHSAYSSFSPGLAYIEEDMDESRSVLHAFRTHIPSADSSPYSASISASSSSQGNGDAERGRAFNYSTPSYESSIRDVPPVPPIPAQYYDPNSATSPAFSPGSTYDNPSNVANTPQQHVPHLRVQASYPELPPLRREYSELSPDHSGANMVFRASSDGPVRSYAETDSAVGVGRRSSGMSVGGEGEALYSSYDPSLRAATPAMRSRELGGAIEGSGHRKTVKRAARKLGLGKAAGFIRAFRDGREEEEKGLISRRNTEGETIDGDGSEESEEEGVVRREEWNVEEVSKTTSTGLRRGLKNRHVTMLSIGGVIGTGLFVGTANSLKNGGPLGVLLAYSIFGSVTWTVLISLGEMVAHLPLAGGHISLSRRFVDPALSFAMGWAYWAVYAILLPTELAAAAVLIRYWNSSVSNAVWITLTLFLLTGINLFGARGYGEVEFWFASIKVVTIVGLSGSSLLPS